MPGVVAPAKAVPLRISPPAENDDQIRSRGDDEASELTRKTRSPMPKAASSGSAGRGRPSPDRSSGKKRNSPAEKPLLEESVLDNPDLGPFLLKLARDTLASGESPTKALDYAIRASKSFERCAQSSGEPSLDLAMSLHVTAAIYCSLGRYEEAVPVLERALQVPEVERGIDHALAAFSGYMQLGTPTPCLDASFLFTKYRPSSIVHAGRLISGQIGRYLAEAHVQALQFDEAEDLCRKTLEIHREQSGLGLLEEATDRRLMALICEAKGNFEAALEHLVLSSMIMIDCKQDNEVAAIDVSIGNIYQSLVNQGDNHSTVASVFVRLADLYYKTGKLRESKSYCENALRIYSSPVPGTSSEEIAGGLTEISAIYEAINEPEEALKLLQKALSLLEDSPGQWNTIAGIEAQIGVMYYEIGRYGEAKSSFQSASVFFGVVLNQMGLACIQLYKIDEAADLFEEARSILEKECGPCHQDTLGVYSNLAATYDAMGRLEDAIKILEYVLKLREEKLGTAHPDVEDEKKRLAELLKEAGRGRNRTAKSLENLLDANSRRVKKEGTRRWSGLGFRI
ncbi:unnamed protein product [Spirodela intermedia]|uniref:Uncharacterized protein n=1 Tax=Spirodela intermedia TaxID=51605 RepID=A0A7I8J6A5_SPIIN|nr:unnamed protein product [Spirodela intermedia]CAA6665766.1 unnamed protein product [Spirodela intermedia]